MRNKYPGICYLCKKQVDIREGHFERAKGKWFIRCLSCVGKKQGDKKYTTK